MTSMIIVNTAIVGFAFLMVWAAFNDVSSFKIPNWIPGLMIGLWAVAMPFMAPGWSFVGLSVLSFIGVLAFGLALWAPGWLGGGDVKLIAAGALWFGWPDVMSFLFMTCLAGGALALGLLLLRRLTPALPISAHLIEKSPLAPNAPAPYGVAIAAAALWVLPRSAVFTAYIA